MFSKAHRLPCFSFLSRPLSLLQSRKRAAEDADKAAASAATAAKAAQAQAQAQAAAEAEASAKRAAEASSAASRPAAKASGSSGFKTASALGANGDWQRTQELLQPLFPKPKLTDKLLGKPPFRFLHDVFMAVQRSTGFGNGLYNAAESDGESVKEKGPKMEWLQKLIDCVGIHLSTHVAASTLAIVAGQEPERTNEMLQLLAIAATSGRSSDEAVRRVLAGAKQPAADGAGAQPIAAAPAPAPAPTAAASHSSTATVELGSPGRAAREASAKQRADAEPVRSAAAATAAANASTSAADANAASASASASAAAVSRTARPSTARRRPPKVNDGATDGTEAANAGGTSAFLAEGAGDSDSDREGEGEGTAADDAAALLAGQANADTLAGAGRGKHTREILSDVRSNTSVAASDGKDDGSGGGIRLGANRLKKAGGRAGGGLGGGSGGALYSAKELEALSATIQKLALSVNPLGKSIDYVTEDAEDMGTELRAWRADQKRRAEAAAKEAAETEAALAPYRRQLAEAEERVKEQSRKTAAIKASIAKNDARIQELLRMVVSK
jgi:TRAF3-interacting protein 1